MDGETSPVLAIVSLEATDPCFWSFGEFSGIGPMAGVSIVMGRNGSDRDNMLFAVYMTESDRVPSYLKPVFEKYFFRIAICVRCLRPMDDMRIGSFRGPDGIGRKKFDGLACSCGHPIWSMTDSELFTAQYAANRAEYAWRRKQRMNSAGGKHSQKEIEDILAIQKGRCIYCNRRFGKRIHWTKDHILPVIDGGANWALNIVMACKSCNSRRGSIPFRTFCRLLSPEQNETVLVNLVNRIVAIGRAGLTGEAYAVFEEGLALHDPRDPRYLDIVRRSDLARKNASVNKLLPRSGSLILRWGLAHTRKELANLGNRCEQTSGSKRQSNHGRTSLGKRSKR